MPPKTDLAEDEDPAEKIDRAQRRYNKSDKGKAAHKKHLETDKGKETVKRYAQSDKGRLSKEKYRHSEKGKAQQLRKGEREKLLRKAQKWLKANPGKTFDDFMKLQHKGEEPNDANEQRTSPSP